MVSTYTIALFLHLLGVLLFTAGIALAGVPFEVARRREDPAGIAVILVLARVGALLAVAGSAVVLACGLWLVHLGRFGYDVLWVKGAIALLLAAFVLGGVAGQRPKRARLHAARLAAAGAPADAELRRLLNDRVSLVANYVSGLIVLAILGLMVFKPGA
jgi:uncharacterized membrane protein